MTDAKPIHAGLLKRSGPRPTPLGKPQGKTYRKVGVRLDLERYAAFKGFCARAGITGEQALVRALDHLLSSEGRQG